MARPPRRIFLSTSAQAGVWWPSTTDGDGSSGVEWWQRRCYPLHLPPKHQDGPQRQPEWYAGECHAGQPELCAQGERAWSTAGAACLCVFACMHARQHAPTHPRTQASAAPAVHLDVGRDVSKHGAAHLRAHVCRGRARPGLRPPLAQPAGRSPRSWSSSTSLSSAIRCVWSGRAWSAGSSSSSSSSQLTANAMCVC